jgi:membrane associated rhomboid family serine protease
MGFPKKRKYQMPWSTLLFLAAIAAGLFLLQRGQLSRISNPVYMTVIAVWLVVGIWTTFGLFSALSVGIPAIALLAAVAALAVWWVMGFTLIKRRREEIRQASASRRRA